MNTIETPINPIKVEWMTKKSKAKWTGVFLGWLLAIIVVPSLLAPAAEEKLPAKENESQPGCNVIYAFQVMVPGDDYATEQAIRLAVRQCEELARTANGSLVAHAGVVRPIVAVVLQGVIRHVQEAL